MWTLQGVSAHTSPFTWSERPCARAKRGAGVKRRERGYTVAGDSRLLACVVFLLRDPYTDAVSINFWWTFGTASSPLTLSSPAPSPFHTSLLPLPPHIVCMLNAFLLLHAAPLCFGAFVSSPGTFLVALTKKQRAVLGFGMNFCFPKFHVKFRNFWRFQSNPELGV